MRIIFLDFDGVLVNRQSVRERSGNHAAADARCVSALNWITDETDARIVVSSTWRWEFKNPDLRGLLRQWGVTGVMIDSTPIKPYTGTRGGEIQLWLTAYQRDRTDVESFVILDDDSDMGELTTHLIKTEFEPAVCGR